MTANKPRPIQRGDLILHDAECGRCGTIWHSAIDAVDWPPMHDCVAPGDTPPTPQ